MATLTRLLGATRVHEQLTRSDAAHLMCRTPAFDHRLLRLAPLELERNTRFIACLERGYPPEATRRRYDAANLCSAVTTRMDQRPAQ